MPQAQTKRASDQEEVEFGALGGVVGPGISPFQKGLLTGGDAGTEAWV